MFKFGPQLEPLPKLSSRCRATDGYCEVLNTFGLFLLDRIIYCRLHQTGLAIVPVSHLSNHLARRHKWRISRENGQQHSKNGKAQFQEAVVNHVAQCCQVEVAQSTASLAITVNVDAPLTSSDLPTVQTITKDSDVALGDVSIGELKEYYKCSECGTWVSAVTKGPSAKHSEFRRHMKDMHPKIGSSALVLKRIQRIAVTGGKGLHYRNNVPPMIYQDSISHTSDPTPPLTLPSNGPPIILTNIVSDVMDALSDPSWVSALGYDSYRQQLGSKAHNEQLRLLVAVPHDNLTINVNPEIRNVEKALLVLRKSIISYLRRALKEIDAKSLKLRAALSQGYVRCGLHPGRLLLTCIQRVFKI